MSSERRETAATVSVDDHLAEIFGDLRPLDPLDLVLTEAHGSSLALELIAPWPLPRFDQATADGYAVRLADVEGASDESPVVLPVLSAIPGGAGAVITGVGVRVGAGQPLPADAEAVVPVEWTEPVEGTGGQQVSVWYAPVLGEFLRRAGDDVAGGAVALPVGAQLGPVQIATLASFGLVRAPVHPHPRALVLSTGAALLETGEPYQNGHGYDGVSHALAAACREAGGTPYRMPTARSTVAALLPLLEDHLIQSDLVIISGTVRPVGYDPILEVLDRLGKVTVRQVAMDPGGTHVFGRIGPDDTPVFVVPPTPVSALVSFEVFVRPALRRLFGSETTQRPLVDVVLAEPIASTRGRRHYVRAQVRHDPARGYVAAPVGVGLQTLTGFAAANALLVVPEETTKAAAGSTLPAMLLERRSS